MELLQCGAAGKHGRAKRAHVLRQGHGFQRGAVLEDVLVVAIDEAAQLEQRIGEDDLLQAFAALEGEFAKDLQRIRELDAAECSAILEGAGADGAQFVAEGDARQRSAALEGALADLANTVRQGHGFQCDAVLECARANRGHAVRDDHVAASSVVGHEHAGFDFKVL